MQFVQECECLKRDCNRSHAFTRVWICLCNDPACKERLHYEVDEFVEKVEKIEKIKESNYV